MTVGKNWVIKGGKVIYKKSINNNIANHRCLKRKKRKTKKKEREGERKEK